MSNDENAEVVNESGHDMISVDEAEDVPSEVDRQLAEATDAGYSFTVRHQPAAELEQPDWVVVITTPDGRVVFPAAVDDEEQAARRRAAAWVADDVAHRQTASG